MESKGALYVHSTYQAHSSLHLMHINYRYAKNTQSELQNIRNINKCFAQPTENSHQWMPSTRWFSHSHRWYSFSFGLSGATCNAHSAQTCHSQIKQKFIKMFPH